ncbi:hypothetical protein D3C77_529510 [compost metagenome]
MGLTHFISRNLEGKAKLVPGAVQLQLGRIEAECFQVRLSQSFLILQRQAAFEYQQALDALHALLQKQIFSSVAIGLDTLETCDMPAIHVDVYC